MQVNINPTTGNPGQELTSMTQKWLGNPIMLSIVLIVILLYYTLFSRAGVDAASIVGDNNGKFLELLLWGVFLTVVIMNALRYFYGSDIVANVSNLFGENPQLDISVTAPEGTVVPDKGPTFSEQVFHIPGNEYNFEDAKAVCAAYNGRLASYNEIEDAYENGADWCSYGWSEGQMAFFPTQQAKWDKLQKVKGHEHSCGRPGINGGYIANPNVKFGVNCYGHKPDISPTETKLMNSANEIPVTKKDREFKKLVDSWKEKIPDILLAPFNKNNWSSI